ncbi:hypothetical protein [Streptomyces sp. NPDC005407]|uniref:hypothetical protein n=1 Tax=Streptomyces sp. NPDC005407 TaxID=3155340 RepID=UPI0033A159DB
MPRDLDELYAINDRMTQILDSGVRERLMALPDVVHVAFGLREAGGRAVVDDFVFKVYVNEKLPAAQLPPERLVPEAMEGVGTDVCEVLKGSPFTGAVPAGGPVFPPPDRPLVGGTMICNGIRGKDPDPTKTDPILIPGTLGIVAARRSDRKPVILSNAHIVGAFQGTSGDPLYQAGPGEVRYPEGTPLPQKPLSATNGVAVISDASLTHQVDAAIAQVNPPSSCCNCGATYTLLIKGFNKDGSASGVTGSAAPVTGMEVVKVGITTGRVEGTVVTTEAVADSTQEGPLEWTFTGQLLIQGHENDKTPQEAPKLFAGRGDSGSVVVEKTTRKVVALLWGGEKSTVNPPPPTVRAYANKITDVIAELGIYFPSSEDVKTAAAGFIEGTVDVSVDVPELFPALQRRLAATPRGREVLEPLTRHAQEIIHLVNHDRRTTVAWHRGQGPSWVAAFARSARRPEYRLPDEIEGVTREQAVTAMRTVLADRGSDALGADLRDTPPAVFAALATCRTFDELITSIDQQPTTPTAAERQS